MPTYDYKCDACGQAWEKVQSIKADPIKTCPHCGQETARRLIGMGAGLIFKGSGFYITDYREKGYADSAKADAAAGGGGEKAADKSDAKPEGKSDKPAEGKPADHKPAESKPAESKPAAATPAASPTPTPTAKGES